MFNESRIDIYDYLHGLLSQSCTLNVYRMNEPQDMTKDDAEKGFIVIRVGQINDESEFGKQVYGWARVFVYGYVPPKSRGRVDKDKYKTMEQTINNVIDAACNNKRAAYGVQLDSMLTMDDYKTAETNFFIVVKSFVVTINE